MAEPWASYEEGQMGWELPGLMPGQVAKLRRIEAAERAEAEREADERADRAETRLQNWVMMRAQQMAFEGKPFDPADWTTLVEPVEVFVERHFAMLDAQDRREERRVLREAGLLGSLPARYADEMAAPTGSSGSTASAAPASAARTSRLRAALHSVTRRGATPCCCTDCVATRAEKIRAKEITR